ncbi:MAG TPA: hypothetical protein PKY95_04575, partial [candidate division Zixibacteria bacterium]|nr:hypothetical protein [candidate division Zixibacteria bacterium]
RGCTVPFASGDRADSGQKKKPTMRHAQGQRGKSPDNGHHGKLLNLPRTPLVKIIGYPSLFVKHLSTRIQRESV